MRAVIQRVKRASVTSGDYAAQIGKGLLVLVAVGKDDEIKDIDYMVDKTMNLRIFSDSEGKLNLSVRDIHGDILAVPQFTLYGDCRKGRRPGFENSAGKEKGNQYFDIYVSKLDIYVSKLKEQGMNVITGLFGKEMDVELVNDGPVTIIVESKKEVES